MAFFKGSGFYHVEAANTNRQVIFQVVAQAGQSNVFVFQKGNNAFHPWVGQIAAPTANQKIAGFRADYVVRFIGIYAIPVYVAVVDVNLGGSETANGLQIGYETYVSNVYPGVTDITDALGKADRTAKTKSGLQTIATSLISTASVDGGGTLLFSASPNLPDGTASTAAAITTLTVTRITPQMGGY